MASAGILIAPEENPEQCDKKASKAWETKLSKVVDYRGLEKASAPQGGLFYYLSNRGKRDEFNLGEFDSSDELPLGYRCGDAGRETPSVRSRQFLERLLVGPRRAFEVARRALAISLFDQTEGILHRLLAPGHLPLSQVTGFGVSIRMDLRRRCGRTLRRGVCVPARSYTEQSATQDWFEKKQFH